MRSHFTDVVTLARPAMMLSDGFDEIKGDAKYVCVCVCACCFLKGLFRCFEYASPVVFTASAVEKETAPPQRRRCGAAFFRDPSSDVTKTPE